MEIRKSLDRAFKAAMGLVTGRLGKSSHSNQSSGRLSQRERDFLARVNNWPMQEYLDAWRPGSESPVSVNAACLQRCLRNSSNPKTP